MDSVPADVGGNRYVFAQGGFKFTGTAYAKPPWSIQRDPSRYMGRVQVGQPVSLFVRCVPGGAPLAPADPGNIRIYGGILGVLSQTLPVETTDAETIGVFRGTFLADTSDPPGRYMGLIAFVAGDFPREEVVNFELLQGGHDLGAVMSLYSVSRPDATAVMTHMESGKITVGRSPYLDEGF